MEEEFDLNDVQFTDPYDGEQQDYGGQDYSNDSGSSLSTAEQNQVVIETALQNAGIENSNNIKFMTEDGDMVNRSWEDLSVGEKLRVMGSAAGAGRDELSDDEAALINDMRQYGLDARSYLDRIYKSGQDSMSGPVQYDVDGMSDDALFMLDALARYGEENISDNELNRLLANAKSDPELYYKTIEALREEYRDKENEMQYNMQQQDEEEREARYAEFSNSILDEIQNFEKTSGLDIELSRDDMNDLANYILTRDGAGNTEFSKDINDPRTFTEMAFWRLKGRQLLNEIPKEINKAYRAGLRAAAEYNRPEMYVRPKNGGGGTGRRTQAGFPAMALDVK